MKKLWFVVVMAAACGGSGSSGVAGSAGLGDRCSTTGECEDGTVCMAYGSGGGVCALNCSADAGACGASAECAGVGSLSIETCQEPENVADAESPPSEETRPYVPCATDAECSALESGAICAEWMGIRDCTLPCASATECNPPTIGGLTITFLECAPDEGDPSRDACLPDPACMANPLDCVSMSF